MQNPYSQPELPSVNYDGRFTIAVGLLAVCLLIVATHLALISIYFHHRFEAEPFGWISAILMVFAVPPLPLINGKRHGRVAKWTCIASGTVMLFVYILQIAQGAPFLLFGPDGWTLLSRFAFCTIAPLLFLIPEIIASSLYRNGLAAIVVFGYLQTIAVENPLISRYYLGWPHQ
ncbi:MAG: hypothetical protein ACK506_04760 [Pirellula sp.]|jgi:hypothetical protein